MNALRMKKKFVYDPTSESEKEQIQLTKEAENIAQQLPILVEYVCDQFNLDLLISEAQIETLDFQSYCLKLANQQRNGRFQ